MSPLRDHQPITIDQFNGLWSRGDKDNTPLDHFTDCENVAYPGMSSFGTRPGIGISQDVVAPLQNIKRIYNYPTPTGSTLIILTYDYITGAGSIYHVVDATTVFGPILTITGMNDFAFVQYAGRGYISPFSAQPPVTPKPEDAPTLTIGNGSDIEAGVHKYAVTFITAVGETTPGPIAEITTRDPIADPAIQFVVTDRGIITGGGGSGLTPGGTYKWKIGFLDAFGNQTLPSLESNSIIAIANHSYGLQITGPIPAEVTLVRQFRTTANTNTYYREVPVDSSPLNYPIVGSSQYAGSGVLGDANMAATQPQPSLTNTTDARKVELTNIPIGGAGVTERNIYRTKAGLAQLQLLTTIADNTTLVYTDTSPDISLGAFAPTQSSAIVAGALADKGLNGEFLYVYAGDGTPARKAAGAAPTGALTIANGAAGHTDAGFHLFAVVFETNSGYLTAPGAITGFTTAAGSSVSFGTVPVGSAVVTKRHIVATKVIVGYNGNTTGYQFFFIPGATINDNTTLFLNNQSFFDQDLLDDASHLLDNFAEIPAGAVLNLYHDRLVLATTFDDISVAYISAPGEPEAIDQINGVIVVPLDGNPITNAQEYRDILYLFKRARTLSYIDNNDEPATWPLVVIDNALGTSVHGIATVLDSGSSSVDYLIVCTYQGVSLFNGRYIAPELSWKIEDFWRGQDRNNFKHIQIVNEPIAKEIYIIIPDNSLLVGNYANGMEPKKIRWAPWTFLMGVNTIAITNIDEIIIGADIVG